MEEILIRDGVIDDAVVAGILMREAGGELMDFLGGGTSRAGTEATLAGLWRRGGNRFSCEHGRMAVIEGQTAGLLLGYPSDAMGRLDLGTGRGLFVLQGLAVAARALRHPFRTAALAFMPEAEPQEWYICVLATLAPFRGRGIGSALLRDAEGRARASGAGALSLIVAEWNSAARSLYAGQGFTERGRFTVTGHASIRMARTLGPPAGGGTHDIPI